MNKHGVTHTTEAGGNVFADLGFDEAEAANLRLRAELLTAIEKWIVASGKSQTEIGRMIGVSQARVSDLKRGKIDRFSLDMLVTFAAKMGLKTDLIIGNAA